MGKTASLARLSFAFCLAAVAGAPGGARAEDPLVAYATLCRAQTQIDVPAFDCDDPASTLVPMTNAFDRDNNPLSFGPNSDFVALYSKVRNGSGGRCDRPDRLNRECDPGSRFHVLARTADAYVVAHCRKKGNPGNTWGDIAVIQHNSKNGATCFYQEGPRDGLKNHVEAPIAGVANEWLPPTGVHGEGCVTCHDDGPIIRSPYLSQITGPNRLPGAGDAGFNASGSPYYFVGPEFADWHVYSVEIRGNLCVSCHRMGANNQSSQGTALDFGLRATGPSEAAKNPHSAASPIWMTPGQVTYSASNAAAAQAIHDCALRRGQNPLPNGDDCRIRQYDGPPSSGWRAFELAGPNSAAGSARVAAVSRIPQSMETFWIGPNGAVRDGFWYEGQPWRQFELAGPGSAAVGAGIAAVSRIPGSMEVFWIGADGSVQDAFWYEGQPWRRFTLAPPGSAAPTSQVAAVSRQPNTMEIFWVAPNGSVQDAFWYDGSPWKRFELAPAGSASAAGGMTVVSRIKTSMELFYVAPNGAVRDAFWYQDAPWRHFELAPPGSAAPSAPITAVSRRPGTMEVFWVGNNGSVQDAFWYDNATWKRFELSPGGSASPTGAIKAVARKPETMEVWWIGAAGSIQDAFWYEGAVWKQFQLAPPGSASLHGGLAAVARIPGSMETWWVGANGAVRDSFFYE